MTTPDEDGSGLEAFFEAEREAAPAPSAALMARVLADAHAVQAGGLAPIRRTGIGLAGGFLAALGGWPAMAGLTAAAVAGLWIGVAVPDAASYFGLSVAFESASAEAAYDLSDIGLGGLAAAGGF